MDDEKISYSDIIQPDDSIDRLAESITDVNAGLAQLLGTVKAHAIAHEAWINEIKASTKKNVEAKDKVEKLTRENVGLTRELENNRSDNF